MASIFAPRAGTHQLWITSGDDHGELHDRADRHDHLLESDLALRVLELPVVLVALDLDLRARRSPRSPAGTSLIVGSFTNTKATMPARISTGTIVEAGSSFVAP